MQDRRHSRDDTGRADAVRHVAKLFRLAPSLAIVGVEQTARTQFRQFATSCDYLNLPKPIVTLFPNADGDFSSRQDWKNIIHEVLRSSQKTIIVPDRISSILPVGANEGYHAHFMIETTIGYFSFDDLIMDGMPSLTRACP